MPQRVTSKKLVKILQSVPEVHFRIQDLAPALVDESGKVDIAKCIDNQAEINYAILEVQRYVKDSQNIRKALYSAGTGKKSYDDLEDLIEDWEADDD